MKGIITWLKRRSAATEDAHPYGGVLSYAGEYHALIIGLAAGFSAGVAGAPEVAAAVGAAAIGVQVPGLTIKKFRGSDVLQEIRREPWYTITGDAIGYAGALVATGATSLAGLF